MRDLFALKKATKLKASAILCATVATAAMATITACKKDDAKSEARPPMEVAVVTAASRDVPIYGEWVGNLDGYINAQIQPQVSGYLVHQDYKEGQQVHKGQVLFEIDPRPFQAAFDQSQGQLQQAKAQLELARINVRRDTPLVAAHALAQSTLDTDTQQAAQIEGIVKADEAALRMAQLNLEWTKVRSLIEGIAGKANVQVGNLVNLQTQLTTVSQVNPIKAFFSISEQEYLDLAASTRKQGASDLISGKKSIPLELLLANGDTYPQKGEIVYVDRGIDNATGTITIAGEFANRENLLRPGQFAKVRALTRTEKDAVVVPQRAVTEQQGKHLIAVVDAHNIATPRIVQVGKQVGTEWIITAGIKAGDRIVTEGNGKIQSPMPVHPVAEQTGGR